MSDPKIRDELNLAARRAFLKRTGKAAFVAPAIALLLSAEKASATPLPLYTQ